MQPLEIFLFDVKNHALRPMNSEILFSNLASSYPERLRLSQCAFLILNVAAP